MGFMLA